MSKRVIIYLLSFAIFTQLILVDDLKAITAEERLIEVEKQLSFFFFLSNFFRK